MSNQADTKQLDDLLSALQALRSNGYAPPDCLPRYWESADPIEEGIAQSDPYSLVAVSMPPEMYEADESSDKAGSEGSERRLTFFGEEVGRIRK